MCCLRVAVWSTQLATNSCRYSVEGHVNSEPRYTGRYVSELVEVYVQISETRHTAGLMIPYVTYGLFSFRFYPVQIRKPFEAHVIVIVKCVQG